MGIAQALAIAAATLVVAFHPQGYRISTAAVEAPLQVEGVIRTTLAELSRLGPSGAPCFAPIPDATIHSRSAAYARI